MGERCSNARDGKSAFATEKAKVWSNGVPRGASSSSVDGGSCSGGSGRDGDDGDNGTYCRVDTSHLGPLPRKQ